MYDRDAMRAWARQQLADALPHDADDCASGRCPTNPPQATLVAQEPSRPRWWSYLQSRDETAYVTLGAL